MNRYLSERRQTNYTLGGRIRHAREALGMSPTEFARAVGVAKVSAWNWENDKTRPRASNIRLIAATLNVSIDGLLRSRAAPTDVNELIYDCKKRIADALGLAQDDIAIVVSFGRLPDE